MPVTRPLSSLRTLALKSCILLVAFVPFVYLPWAFDPAQAPRALTFTVACACALLAAGAGVRTSLSRTSVYALAAGLGALTLAVVSAAMNGPASALWGVSGRFLGLTAAGVVLLGAVSGYLVFVGEARRLGSALSVALVAQSVVVVAQALMHVTPSGTLVNPVLTGGWLAVASGVSLASARVEQGCRRVVAFAAAASGVVALALTGSRGAWIGLAGALVFVLAADKARRRKTAMFAGAALAVLLVAVVLSGSAAGKLGIADLVQGSAGSRLAIWSSTSKMVAEAPLLGVGPGRFLFVFPGYQSAQHARLEAPDMRADQAHSLLLHIAAENGLPAALLLAAVCGFALIEALRGARSGDAASLLAGAGLSAYVAQGVFGISTMQTDPLAWMLLGVVLARSDALRARKQPGLERVKVPLRGVGVATSGALALAIALYVVADIQYGASQSAFREARFDRAESLGESAVRLDPLVDVYRVGLADIDAARLMSRSPVAQPDRALAALERGLVLEPADFDLALARARLLRDAGAPPQDVVKAYREAMALYPRGITVRYEAIEAYVRAGDGASAKAVATDVLREYPQDAFALGALGRLSDG